MSARLGLLVAIGALMLASCISLVYLQHERRTRFMELKALERERDQMLVEWGQLQLEASTWAAQDRIESLAVDELGFRVPSPSAVVLVGR